MNIIINETIENNERISKHSNDSVELNGIEVSDDEVSVRILIGREEVASFSSDKDSFEKLKNDFIQVKDKESILEIYTHSKGSGDLFKFVSSNIKEI